VARGKRGQPDHHCEENVSVYAPFNTERTHEGEFIAWHPLLVVPPEIRELMTT
jgi:hypothetical protein